MQASCVVQRPGSPFPLTRKGRDRCRSAWWRVGWIRKMNTEGSCGVFPLSLPAVLCRSCLMGTGHIFPPHFNSTQESPLLQCHQQWFCPSSRRYPDLWPCNRAIPHAQSSSYQQFWWCVGVCVAIKGSFQLNNFEDKLRGLLWQNPFY